jgi:hypothetical protein
VRIYLSLNGSCSFDIDAPDVEPPQAFVLTAEYQRLFIEN